MDKTILKTLTAFFLATLLLAACRKEINQPVDKTAYFELALNGLAATTVPAQDLQVIISAVNAGNEAVFTNKKISLAWKGGLYRSEKLNGQAGNYTLTSLQVINGSRHTAWAAPKSGSAKAAGVQQVLPKVYNLRASETAVVHVDVLPVIAGDAAESFGYPAGSFNIPGPVNNNVFTIKVKTIITIGQVEYDRLPATLTITGYKNDQSTVITTVPLQAGENAVPLSKEFEKYKLGISKWGVTDEVTLLQSEVQDNMLVTLGGSKAAKRLLQEDKYLLVQGVYRPDGKTFYTYNPDGSLKQVDYQQKKPQSADLQLTVTDKFIYGNNKLQRIDRFDGAGILTGYTDFIYNEAGKIINMHKKSYDQDTWASVAYGTSSGNPVVNLDYLFHNGHAMEYTMNFKNGNMVSDIATSSTGGSEGGNYQYDYNINPYVHMQYPDIYLKNLSRNNMIVNGKSFAGGFPVNVPYQYDYNYDADGYPSILEVSYKGYTSGEFLFKIKTVYTYQQ